MREKWNSHRYSFQIYYKCIDNPSHGMKIPNSQTHNGILHLFIFRCILVKHNEIDNKEKKKQVENSLGVENLNDNSYARIRPISVWPRRTDQYSQKIMIGVHRRELDRNRWAFTRSHQNDCTQIDPKWPIADMSWCEKSQHNATCVLNLCQTIWN